MGKFIDLTGQKFGKLVVIERAGTGNTGQALWKCRCDCGNETNVLSDNLRRGKQVSCGCYYATRKITHGKTKSDEYKIWQGIKNRCLNPNSYGYKDYGGRGIKVCERWIESFENFYADMGTRPSPNHSIDRINVDGDYEPGNCRWATQSVQNLNQRLSSKNSSGHKGVSWDKRYKKWVAYIDVGRRKNLGYYVNLEDAIKARKEGEQKYWSKYPSA